MKEKIVVTIREYTRNIYKYLKPGTYVVTKNGKNYIKKDHSTIRSHIQKAPRYNKRGKALLSIVPKALPLRTPLLF